MPGRLLVVATPIGNLADISRRAADALRSAEVLYAEDTRHTRILLEHLGIARTPKSLHAHNERSRVTEVLEHLQAGRSVALVTDAGTPAVSDPCADVVRAAGAAGCRVVPVVGPSALTAALSVSGFPCQDVWFVGFLPTRRLARQERLERIAAWPGIVVLFESPNRVSQLLADLGTLSPDRPICVARELTKAFEEIRHTTLRAARENLTERGEFTLVLGPMEAPAAPEETWREHIPKLLAAGLSTRDVALALSVILNISHREAYAATLHCEKP